MFAVLLLALATTPDVVKDGSTLVFSQTDQASFLIAPSDNINKIHPPKPKALQTLIPAKGLTSDLNSLMGSIVTTKQTATSGCATHTTEKLCVVDMECGWCLQPEGGACVVGNYAGPSDGSVACPIYVTYQIPTQAEEKVDSSLFADFENTTKPVTDDFAEPLEPLTPIDTPADIDGDNDPDDELAPTQTPVPTPDPDTRNAWGKRENKTDPHTIEQGLTKTRHTVISGPIMPLYFAESKYDASVSPCGLPGVPQFVCDAWLKTHCGADQLTDDVIRNLPAANNGYDWCSTLFEHNPPVALPERAQFPWYINGQLVQ